MLTPLMVVVVVVATTQVATQVAQPPRLQPPPLGFEKYCAQVLCFVFVFCVLCFQKNIPASLMVVVVVVATTQVATQIARPPRWQVATTTSQIQELDNSITR